MTAPTTRHLEFTEAPTRCHDAAGDDYTEETGTTGAGIDGRSTADWFAVTLEAGKKYEIA